MPIDMLICTNYKIGLFLLLCTSTVCFSETLNRLPKISAVHLKNSELVTYND